MDEKVKAFQEKSKEISDLKDHIGEKRAFAALSLYKKEDGTQRG